MMLHLDPEVVDLEAAVAHAIEIGAQEAGQTFGWRWTRPSIRSASTAASPHGILGRWHPLGGESASKIYTPRLRAGTCGRPEQDKPVHCGRASATYIQDLQASAPRRHPRVPGSSPDRPTSGAARLKTTNFQDHADRAASPPGPRRRP